MDSTKTAQPKVLVIDDEQLLRNSIKKILERAGFYVETALDYQTAQKCVENLQFDLILIDVVLPKMSGISLIEKLQQQYELNAAIIFITGEPNLETAVNAIRVGANDYLEKPINRSELVEAIKRAMKNRQHEIQIIEKSKNKTFGLNDTFLNTEDIGFDDESIETVLKSLEEMHQALLELKKKWGKDFNEEQRKLLNILAKNQSQMSKTLHKME